MAAICMLQPATSASAADGRTDLFITAVDKITIEARDVVVDAGDPYRVSADVSGGWGEKAYSWTMSADDGGTWNALGSTDSPNLSVPRAQTIGDVDTVYLYSLRIDDAAGQHGEALIRATVRAQTPEPHSNDVRELAATGDAARTGCGRAACLALAGLALAGGAIHIADSMARNAKEHL